MLRSKLSSIERSRRPLCCHALPTASRALPQMLSSLHALAPDRCLSVCALIHVFCFRGYKFRVWVGLPCISSTVYGNIYCVYNGTNWTCQELHILRQVRGQTTRTCMKDFPTFTSGFMVAETQGVDALR